MSFTLSTDILVFSYNILMIYYSDVKKIENVDILVFPLVLVCIIPGLYPDAASNILYASQCLVSATNLC
jgi:hypothetical protein